jgi:hypothetical protein
MPENQPPASGPARLRQVTTALWLVSISVAFGMLSGAVSVTTGLENHSLSVSGFGEPFFNLVPVLCPALVPCEPAIVRHAGEVNDIAAEPNPFSLVLYRKQNLIPSAVR